MAKRKRLTPAQDTYLDTDMPDLETKSIGLRLGSQPPIAQVAGEAAAASALQELADEVKQAKDDGRMIVKLPLSQVEVGYLVRDRIMADEDELQVLMNSLRSRGQQTPIEVVELGQGRYGLISGWRRLTALGRLAEETGEDRFKVVQALIRKPETAEAAYTAMVEENEIRVGLSYYERARIAAKAVEQEVFETEKAALQELFHAASRAKRSKIKSFLALYHAADDLLRFASAIPERVGVALSRLLEAEPKRATSVLRETLTQAAPDTAEQEQAALQHAVATLSKPEPNTGGSDTTPLNPKAMPVARKPLGGPGTYTISEGLEMYIMDDRLVLRGPGLDDALREELVAWLRTRLRLA